MDFRDPRHSYIPSVGGRPVVSRRFAEPVPSNASIKNAFRRKKEEKQPPSDDQSFASWPLDLRRGQVDETDTVISKEISFDVINDYSVKGVGSMIQKVYYFGRPVIYALTLFALLFWTGWLTYRDGDDQADVRVFFSRVNYDKSLPKPDRYQYTTSSDYDTGPGTMVFIVLFVQLLLSLVQLIPAVNSYNIRGALQPVHLLDMVQRATVRPTLIIVLGFYFGLRDFVLVALLFLSFAGVPIFKLLAERAFIRRASYVSVGESYYKDMSASAYGARNGGQTSQMDTKSAYDVLESEYIQWAEYIPYIECKENIEYRKMAGKKGSYRSNPGKKPQFASNQDCFSRILDPNVKRPLMTVLGYLLPTALMFLISWGIFLGAAINTGVSSTDSLPAELWVALATFMLFDIADFVFHAVYTYSNILLNSLWVRLYYYFVSEYVTLLIPVIMFNLTVFT